MDRATPPGPFHQRPIFETSCPPRSLRRVPCPTLLCSFQHPGAQLTPIVNSGSCPTPLKTPPDPVSRRTHTPRDPRHTPLGRTLQSMTSPAPQPKSTPPIRFKIEEPSQPSRTSTISSTSSPQEDTTPRQSRRHVHEPSKPHPLHHIASRQESQLQHQPRSSVALTWLRRRP